MPDEPRRIADSEQRKQALHFRDFGHLAPIGTKTAQRLIERLKDRVQFRRAR